MKQFINIIFRNLANLFTWIRILATFLVCYKIRLMLSAKNYIDMYIEIAVLFLIVWLSDIVDGKVARRLGIVSPFGARLDVIADTLFVFMLHILLASYHIVPIWFIALIVEKILNYVVSSYIGSKNKNRSFDFIRDPLGKVVAASYFLTPCLLLSAYMIGATMLCIAKIIIAAIALLGLCSSVYRITRVLNLDSLQTNVYILGRRSKGDIKYAKKN